MKNWKDFNKRLDNIGRNIDKSIGSTTGFTPSALKSSMSEKNPLISQRLLVESEQEVYSNNITEQNIEQGVNLGYQPLSYEDIESISEDTNIIPAVIIDIQNFLLSYTLSHDLNINLRTKIIEIVNTKNPIADNLVSEAINLEDEELTASLLDFLDDIQFRHVIYEEENVDMAYSPLDDGDYS